MIASERFRASVRVLGRWLERLQQRTSEQAPRTKRLLLALAVLVFVIALVVAVRKLPDLERGLRWVPLLILGLAAIPTTFLLNAAEYAISARILGYRVRRVDAMRVSVIGSAANVLPLPGALLVRLRALHGLGSGFGKATASTAAVGLAWMGTTSAFAGALQLVAQRWGLGTVLVAAGLVINVFAYLLVWFHAPRDTAARRIVEIQTVELGFVLVTGLRYYLAVTALGFSVSASQAVALTVPVVMASAIGFFPGGLGIREMLAAGISPIIGLPAAVGVTATALDRLVDAVALTLLSLLLLRAPTKHETLAAPPHATRTHDESHESRIARQGLLEERPGGAD